ncbi:MAG TPA: 23S rRNA (adenine(2503)-C(2))-methyltransferase RlmN [Bacteroidales bacterium]|nr:23S rRNA (adenine(2503)-C(2))-methyltransferase RlmN [Bacteroidales bacterium]
MSEKENLFGKTIGEIKEITEAGNLPGYAVKQITDWLYKKGVSSIEEMTNLPKVVREHLGSKYYIGLKPPAKHQLSSDGTKKYLFEVKSRKFVEAVFIPEPDRATLCLSSQIGCKMGCAFCMTARQGFQGNLTPGDILNQVMALPEREQLSNYVFMGMGEPLANTENLLKSLEIMTSSYGLGLSPSRITVSTIGIIPGLEQVIDNSKCHIAISLHSPFDEERQQLMPVQKIFPVTRVIDTLKRKTFDRQRRISFEYIMFKGINDTARHINGLTRLLNGLRCRINLIRYHSIPDAPFEASDENTIQWFKERLNEKGILTTIRASRGKDIFAACGMLSTSHQAAENL